MNGTVLDLRRDLDLELHALLQVESREPVYWGPRRAGDPVWSEDELRMRIAGLSGHHAWGLVSRPGGRWGQVMVVTEEGLIVEVHDGTILDFAQRVMRGERVLPTDEQRETPPAEERFDAGGAARILWAWMHGELPAGLVRVRCGPFRAVRGG